jgi:hypothetical protein
MMPECEVGACESLLKPAGQNVLDDGSEVEADHPLGTESVGLFDVVVELQLQLPGRRAKNEGLPDREIQWNGPLLGYPVVGNERSAGDTIFTEFIVRIPFPMVQQRSPRTCARPVSPLAQQHVLIEYSLRELIHRH